MNRDRRVLGGIVSGLLILFCITGCLGQKARDTVTFRAVYSTSDRVLADVRAGILDAQEAGELTDEQVTELHGKLNNIHAAFVLGDRAEVAALTSPVQWAELHELAMRGIMAKAEAGGWWDDPLDDDDIPEAAESMVERLANFEASLAVLAERLD